MHELKKKAEKAPPIYYLYVANSVSKLWKLQLQRKFISVAVAVFAQKVQLQLQYVAIAVALFVRKLQLQLQYVAVAVS